MAGRKNRNGKKIQVTLDSVELEKYEELNSDTLAIRFAFRKAFGLCLHDILSEDADGILFCANPNCGEVSPESFSKFTNLKPKNDERKDSFR